MVGTGLLPECSSKHYTSPDPMLPFFNSECTSVLGSYKSDSHRLQNAGFVISLLRVLTTSSVIVLCFGQLRVSGCIPVGKSY